MSRFLRNSLISLACFPVLFLIFGWEYVLSNFLFYTGNEQYLPMFSHAYSREILYNKTLHAIEHMDFSEAHMNLSRLIQDPPVAYRGDISELYGDVLWRENGATGDILKLYTIAKDIIPSTRLDEKIALLQSHREGEKPMNHTTNTGSGMETQKLSTEDKKFLDQTKQSLQETLENRGQYMNPIGITPEDRKQFLRDTIEFTDTNVEPIDW